MQRAISLVIDQLLGWERKAGGAPPPVANSTEIHAYNSGEPVGPTANDFRLDWAASPHTGWNLTASLVFADLFVEWVGSSPSQSLMSKHKMSHDVLSLAFRKRFYRLQAQFWKSSVSSQVPPTLQPEQIVGSIHSQTAEDRWRGRQRKLFQNREDIILAHPEWEPAYWDALQTLGVDGMSSDESETETRNNRFWRIPQPWRSYKLDRMLNCVNGRRDEATRQTHKSHRSGQPFCVRIGDHPTKRSMRIPPGLPINFYSQAWMDEHPEIAKYLRPGPSTKVPLN
ncbi:hypothetical protein M422DRAFT_262506 [Sphaerobolus stellatus SS14]|uniref:Uncharacterized protein n=1 Tax=Sphaerobolus stellatus (strain SS14) TaxID=990650 RepID=A0A0C9VCT9_SPHS4|nr:hypothetical protein M422DRAFT_262506 [Sphaerobolus stellatus SS14]